MDAGAMSDAANIHVASEPQTGNKRSASPSDSSLFVRTAISEERELQPEGERSPKRAKTERESSTTFNVAEQELNEEGYVPAYDPTKEAYPPLAYYHPSFKVAKGLLTEACNLVTSAYQGLEKNGYKNEEIAAICFGDSSNLDSCRPSEDAIPQVDPVAILGPAGSGKSSATNSIMSSKTAAFAHDGCERGTYVVHEYQYSDRKQDSQYLVKVPYYSRADIQADMAIYRKDISKFLSDDDTDDAGDDDEDDALKQAYDTAIDYFFDLLCDQEEFQTKDKIGKWFEKRIKDDESDVIGELTVFLDAFLSTRALNADHCEERRSHSEEGLSEIFKDTSRPSKGSSKKKKKASPWPIVRKVVVHQDIGLLKEGLVLADTPGINDQNLVVVANTKNYLKTAGTILVFLSYKRIIKNSPLDQILRQCVALNKASHTVLVVTMIDDMKNLSDDEKEHLADEELAPLQAAERKLKKIASQAKEVKDAKSKARGTNNDLYTELDGKLQTLEVQKAQADAAVKQAKIQLRCFMFKNDLKGKLREIEGSRGVRDLPIMFVSNTEYQKHIEPGGYDPLRPPILDVDATGIPPLRKFLLTIPAGDKFKDLQGIVNNRLPNVLNGINGILTKSPLERKAEVRRVLLGAVGNAGKPITDLKDEVQGLFNTRILATMRDNEDDWKSSVDDMLERWAALKAMSFKGVCYRKGEWLNHPSLNKDLRWNRDIQNLYKGIMKTAFDRLSEDLDGVNRGFRSGVGNTFYGLQRSIETSEHAQGKSLQPFFEFCHSIRDEILAEMAMAFTELQNALSVIRHATIIDTPDSYSALAMDTTYDACYEAKKPEETGGGGKRKRRGKKPTVKSVCLEILKGKFYGTGGQPSLFQEIGNMGKQDLHARLKVWCQNCGEIMKTGYGKIIADFERRFADNEVKQEEDPEAVRVLQEAVHKAKEIINIPLKAALAECEQYGEDDKLKTSVLGLC